MVHATSRPRTNHAHRERLVHNQVMREKEGAGGAADALESGAVGVGLGGGGARFLDDM